MAISSLEFAPMALLFRPQLGPLPVRQRVLPTTSARESDVAIADSLSCGASIVHPSCRSILLTAICPHSLSFRPIVFSAGVTITLRSQLPASATFDGARRVALQAGDTVQVQTSQYPLAFVCKESESADWLRNISTSLHWNSKSC